MTSEEAIKMLKSKMDGHTDTSYEWAETVRMAIKALEQQNKVLDAIKEIKDLFKQPAAYVPNYEAYGLCLSIICKHVEVEE